MYVGIKTEKMGPRQDGTNARRKEEDQEEDQDQEEEDEEDEEDEEENEDEKGGRKIMGVFTRFGRRGQRFGLPQREGGR